MPNGAPDFHDRIEPEYDAFFAPLAAELQHFATRHRLKLKKYYQEEPVWSFLFRHPHGGVAKIDIEKQSDDQCTIRQSWWQDDYDAGVRSLRQQQSVQFSRHATRIEAFLDTALKEILSWPIGSWSGTHGGFAEIWQRTWSRNAFKELDSAYPFAIP
jgi:hypothetical protein